MGLQTPLTVSVQLSDMNLHFSDIRLDSYYGVVLTLGAWEMLQ